MVMLEMHRERIKDITGRIKGSCPTDRRLWCNIMVEIESMFFQDGQNTFRPTVLCVQA
jgi:hypothetical protein